MEQKHILLSLLSTYLVDICGCLDDSGVAGILAGTLRIDVAVCIVKMQDHEILGLHCRRSNCGKSEYGKYKLLHDYLIIVTLPSFLDSSGLPAAVSAATNSRTASMTFTS